MFHPFKTMRKPLPYVICLILSLSSLPVRAQDTTDRYTLEREPNRLVGSIGLYNATDSDSEQRYPTYRLEYRMSEVPVWKLHPWVGYEYAQNDIEGVDIKTHWIGGGLETDIDLYDDWLVLTLQTGVGYFDAGEDLPIGWQYLPNDGLQFRHQIEMGVRFADGWRAGVGISHMSNADLQSNNNSINSAMFNLHAPLGFTSGQ